MAIAADHTSGKQDVLECPTRCEPLCWSGALLPSDVNQNLGLTEIVEQVVTCGCGLAATNRSIVEPVTGPRDALAMVGECAAPGNSVVGAVVDPVPLFEDDLPVLPRASRDLAA